MGVKWLGLYQVKEVIRQGGAYVVENVFNGATLRRAAGKVKPYVGQEGILLQHRELYLPDAEEEESEEELPRPRRERRAPQRYGQDVKRVAEHGGGYKYEYENEEDGDRPDRENRREEELNRPRRERRTGRSYLEEYSKPLII